MLNSELIYQGSTLEIWSKTDGITLSLPWGDFEIPSMDDFHSLIDDIFEYWNLQEEESVPDDISNLFHLKAWLEEREDDKYEADDYE